jgi:hypothetical protein
MSSRGDRKIRSFMLPALVTPIDLIHFGLSITKEIKKRYGK